MGKLDEASITELSRPSRNTVIRAERLLHCNCMKTECKGYMLQKACVSCHNIHGICIYLDSTNKWLYIYIDYSFYKHCIFNACVSVVGICLSCGVVVRNAGCQM